MKRQMNQLDNRLPSMCGSPSVAHLGQHWPPAVGQQCPHVPGILQGGGQSLLTECVLCVCGWVGGGGKSESQSERRKGRGKREGEKRWVGEGEREKTLIEHCVTLYNIDRTL